MYLIPLKKEEEAPAVEIELFWSEWKHIFQQLECEFVCGEGDGNSQLQKIN